MLPLLLRTFGFFLFLQGRPVLEQVLARRGSSRAAFVIRASVGSSTCFLSVLRFFVSPNTAEAFGLVHTFKHKIAFFYRKRKVCVK